MLLLDVFPEVRRHDGKGGRGGVAIVVVLGVIERGCARCHQFLSSKSLMIVG